VDEIGTRRMDDGTRRMDEIGTRRMDDGTRRMDEIGTRRTEDLAMLRARATLDD
jgi:hypothetical protein